MLPALLSIHLFILSASSIAILPSQAKLCTDYYRKTCPNFENIMQETTTSKQIASPTTAAAVLRLFVHDCMVEGCDASILISSNSFNTAERDADINLSLPGDAYDLVVRAKTAVELSCPGIVSCADIIALATRNLVTMVGGPFYKVPLGRRDGLVSRADRVEGNLARPNMTMDNIISMFAAKGYTVQEMVALMGGHTIGFSHCKEFSDRVYNFTGYGSRNGSDPDYNPTYAAGLRRTCENFTRDTGMSAFNDVMTPSKFDNMFFKNLPRGLGLLKSDHALFTHPRTNIYVELYARDQDAFFRDFAKAMQKMSTQDIKTDDTNGEVRHRCDTFNSIQT